MFPQILNSAHMVKFYHWQQILQLFSLNGQMYFIFMNRSTKYPHQNNHKFPVSCFLNCKWGSVRKGVSWVASHTTASPTTRGPHGDNMVPQWQQERFLRTSVSSQCSEDLGPGAEVNRIHSYTV